MKNSIRSFIALISEIKYVLTKQQRRQALILLMLMFVGSLLELLSVSAIVPFIQGAVSPEQLKNEAIGRIIWNAFQLDFVKHPLVMLGLFLMMIYIGKNLFLILIAYVRFSYTTQWQKELSIRMLRSYMARPYTFFLNANSAEVLRGCSDDTNGFFDLLNYLFVFIMETVTVCVMGIYLVALDAFTAIGVIALVLLTMGGMVFFFKPAMKKAGSLNVEALTERNKSITQAVQGIKDILVMQRKKPFIEAYESAADKARRCNRKRNFLGAIPDRVTEAVCVSGIIGVVCVRVLLGDETMVSFLPKLAAFAMAAFKILPSVGKITNALNACMFGRPLQHNIYLNIKEAERYDKDYEVNETCDGNSIDLEAISEKFTIKLNAVCWRYENQNANVLDHASMSIKKGESVGLIGPSGAGKTTTADMILGLLRPQEGSVTINDMDVYSIPVIWSRLVGYVPQSVFLMDDTVRSNVVFGLNTESDEEVWDALERAQLKGFVKALPQGLDTVVGERGVKFSGGQRQRIAIARALFTKPQILVLDEATAALDNETENAVMESIEALQGDITLIIVAHRLTTIRKCNRVYEIKDGIAKEVMQ